MFVYVHVVSTLKYGLDFRTIYIFLFFFLLKMLATVHPRWPKTSQMVLCHRDKHRVGEALLRHADYGGSVKAEHTGAQEGCKGIVLTAG